MWVVQLAFAALRSRAVTRKWDQSAGPAIARLGGGDLSCNVPGIGQIMRPS